MDKRRNNLVLCACFILCYACNNGATYHVFTYQPTPLYHWDKSEQLTFPLGSVTQTGDYQLAIHVRWSNLYTLQRLWLRVEMHGHASLSAQAYERVDTIEFVMRQDRSIKEPGLSLFQQSQPLSVIPLRRGQTGEIRIQHIMRCGRLVGVSDVGIELTRKE